MKTKYQAIWHRTGTSRQMRHFAKGLLFVAASMSFAVILIRCRNTPPAYRYQAPKELNDGLRISTLTSEQMDTAPVLKLTNLILADSFPNIRSLLIARNGKLLYENYFSGKAFITGQGLEDFLTGAPEDLSDCGAITMTVTGACIGIAIRHGAIKSVDEPIISYFPAYSKYFDSVKRKITIRHLLTMTSGLDWNEQVADDDPKNSQTQMDKSADPIEFIISRDIRTVPGASFNYNRASAQLLEQIIFKSSGKRLDEFAQTYLFTPIGIGKYAWTYLRNNMVAAAWGLQLRPRDFIKLGLLYLGDGKWNNAPIIDSAFARQSVSPQITWEGNDKAAQGYGYLVSTYQVNKDGVLTGIAESAGGSDQSIYMCYPLHFLAVFTGPAKSQAHYRNDYYKAIGDYIFTSVH